MEINDENNQRQNGGGEGSLNLDRVFATQSELGPSIPDGGYGWVIFFASLFFQALVPSLVVNFGIFMIFVRLENGSADLNKNPSLWEEKLLYVPLFYAISKTIFDPLGRFLISKNSWPRLLCTSGTCSLCAGLLFMWMGIVEDGGGVSLTFYIVAGLLAGGGSALLLAQCEILLSQYFRLKLPVLIQINRAVIALGFMVSPAILGHHILRKSLIQVILWYLAVIIQGIVFGLLFKKPAYLTSKPRSYQFIYNSGNNNADDEENIFSKNARELQITRQSSTNQDENHVTKIQLDPLPSSSSYDVVTTKEENPPEGKQKNWEKFEDEDLGYEKLEHVQDDWITFEDEDSGVGSRKPSNWERFDDGDDNKNTLSLAEEISNRKPAPLFSPVNNNNSYSFDDEITTEPQNSVVFTPHIDSQSNFANYNLMMILKEPTFYKSLLMVITNNYSTFVYFTLFPSYLYLECDNVKLHNVSLIIATLSSVTLAFSALSYWINFDKKRRAYCFWFLCWAGSVGYFMIADYQTELVLLIGSVLVLLSISSLDHIGKDLIGINIRGERRREYGTLVILGGFALFLFLAVDMTFKTCFRLMAVLHFFVGALWLANFIYKKIRI